MSTRERSDSGAHPWLIGIGVGLFVAAMAIASAWFPSLSRPRALMTMCAGAVGLGIVISTFWRFLRSWRLWISLGVAALDAICIRVLPGQIHNLTLWDIDVIAVFELFVTMLFLSWFLDTKKARAEALHRKHES